MKVLLIAPEYEYSHRIPLGIAYIGAVLNKIGVDVEAIDFCVEDNAYDILDKKLESVDFVGITSTTPTFPNACKIAAAIKKNFPKKPIVIGGAHPSVMPEQCLKTGFFDIIVRGEGEETMKDLVLHFNSKIELKNISGISYIEHDRIKHNKDRTLIADINEIPLPSRKLFPVEKYNDTLPDHEEKATTLITSRGCPWSCVYCNKSIFGKKYRFREPDNIIEEIKNIIQDYNVKHFNIMDDLFTLNKNRVIDFCNMLISENIVIKWRCVSRTNTIDEEILRIMKKAGCVAISFGVESGDKGILKKIKKGATTNQVRNAFAKCRKVGISTYAYFMIGFPWDTKKTIETTINFARRISPTGVTFYVVTPLPGTELWTIAEERGLVLDDDFSKYYYGSKLDELPIFERPELSKTDIIYYRELAGFSISLQKRLSLRFKTLPLFIIKILFKISKIGYMRVIKQLIKGKKVKFSIS